MQKLASSIVILFTMLFSGAALSAPIATGTLAFYDQDGSITNSAGATANITQVVYSLGAAGDGIATWDSTGNDGFAGGTGSDFLSDPRYFQTITFSGLSIAPGASFNFGTLDIDLIETLSPLSVTGGTLDTIGTSLANAFVSLTFSDGSMATANLEQLPWSDRQSLSFYLENSNVPAPEALGLLGLGLLVMGAFARRRA